MSSPQGLSAEADGQALRAESAAMFPVLATMAVAVAAFVAPLIVGVSAARALTLLGIADPGPLTTYGLPAVRAIADLAGTLAIGSLLFAAFLTPSQRNGLLDVAGHRALRRAGICALMWAGTAALLVPLALFDTTGQPVRGILRPEQVWHAIGQVEVAGAWRATVFMAFALAVGCRLALRWGWLPPLFAWSLACLLPITLTGHSFAGGAHDIATNSLTLHLAGVTVWAGGLFAVLAHAVRGGAHTDLATRRFSAWAGGELPLVVVMLALLIQWSRSDSREAKPLDRAADRDHDAELSAHNAMFAELAGHDGAQR